MCAEMRRGSPLYPLDESSSRKGMERMGTLRIESPT